jgi:hypothetical protein
MARSLEEIARSYMDRWWPEQSQRSNQTRKLTDQDYHDFNVAAESRQPPKNIDLVAAEIKASNPHRWRRMRGDHRWLRKKLAKRGMNPDDARWLIPQ